MKQTVLDLIGYEFTGTVYVDHWGGGAGAFEMDRRRVFIDRELTEDELERFAVLLANDAQFGVERITGIDLMIDELYECDHKEEFYGIALEDDPDFGNWKLAQEYADSLGATLG